jgi:hypothetical protein
VKHTDRNFSLADARQHGSSCWKIFPSAPKFLAQTAGCPKCGDRMCKLDFKTRAIHLGGERGPQARLWNRSMSENPIQHCSQRSTNSINDELLAVAASMLKKTAG